MIADLMNKVLQGSLLRWTVRLVLGHVDEPVGQNESKNLNLRERVDITKLRRM